MQTFRIYPNLPTLHRFIELLDDVIGNTNYVLAFVVVDEIQQLQCGYHILLLDACHLTNFTEKKFRLLLKKHFKCAKMSYLIVINGFSLSPVGFCSSIISSIHCDQ